MLNNDSKARFPEQLQEGRLRRGWKQTKLAEELGVKLRTLISWETGERVPTVGTVVCLGALLETDLLSPYIEDDVKRRYGQAAIGKLVDGLAGTTNVRLEKEAHNVTDFTIQEETSLQQERTGTAASDADLVLEQLQRDSGQEADAANSLQSLFHIFEILQAQPSLIPVTLDFLEEMAETRPG